MGNANSSLREIYAGTPVAQSEMQPATGTQIDGNDSPSAGLHPLEHSKAHARNAS